MFEDFVDFFLSQESDKRGWPRPQCSILKIERPSLALGAARGADVHIATANKIFISGPLTVNVYINS